jgi:BMFP domain-containing protein YqiC
MKRAQQAVEETRERLDLVPRREFDALRDEVAELRRRLAALEGHGEGGGVIPVDGE